MKGKSLKDFTTPFNRLLGIRVARLHRDGVTVDCRITDSLRNGLGTLHGGVTATLVDVAVGVAAVQQFKNKRRLSTVEMKLNYFLPLVDGRVTARCRLLRVGTTLVIGAVEVKDAKGRLAAFGTATYKVIDAI